MPGKPRPSLLGDLTRLVSLLPWWAGVLLAGGSWWLIHPYAVQPVPVAVPGDVGVVVSRGLLRALAFWGQYLVPGVCLIGAAVSAWKSRERRALVDGVAQSDSLAFLDAVSWKQFERLVGEAFRLRGYAVSETGGGGADGGVDLVLTKGSERFLVQCKQWKALKVGVDVVRELFGVMAAKGATGGFVVTSGQYTREARAFAEGRNLQLIDGAALRQMIASVQWPDAATPPAGRTADFPSTAPGARPTPDCPECGKAMIRRVARRGSNAGAEFWGCSGYPQCKGTRPA